MIDRKDRIIEGLERDMLLYKEQSTNWKEIAGLFQDAAEALYTALLVETAGIEIREDATDAALNMYEKLRTIYDTGNE